MLNRRNLLKVAATTPLIAAFPCAAFARDGLIKVTVGYAPGGPGEVLCRMLVKDMAETLGKTIIVDNKPGAGGMLAAIEIVKAPADGSAMIYSPPGIVTTQPLVDRKLPYDPAAIEPLAGICDFSFAIAVKADHPAKSLKEYAEWAKKNGLIGVLGLGNMPHFIGFQLGREGGFPFEPVPYKGSKPLEVDILGGTVPSGISIVAAFTKQHQAGAIRVLGVTGAKRSKQLPDVPTFAEQGFPSIVAEESFAFFGPKGSSAQFKTEVYEALVKALQQPKTAGFMKVMDFEPNPLPAEKYAAALADWTKRWKPVVEATGFHTN